jgi:hypothetical protein
MEALIAKGKSIEADFNRLVAVYSKDFGRLQQAFEVAFKERAAVQSELASLAGP